MTRRTQQRGEVKSSPPSPFTFSLIRRRPVGTSYITPYILPLHLYSTRSYPPPPTISGWSGCLGTQPSLVMSALMRSPEISHTGRLGKTLSASNQPLTPTALTLQSYASLGNIILLLSLLLLAETPSCGDNCKLTLSRPPSSTLTSTRHSARLSARTAATVPTFFTWSGSASSFPPSHPIPIPPPPPGRSG